MNSLLRILVTGLALVSFAGMASAAGDAEKGKKVFKRCVACHKVGEGAKHRSGPSVERPYWPDSRYSRRFQAIFQSHEKRRSWRKSLE